MPMSALLAAEAVGHNSPSLPLLPAQILVPAVGAVVLLLVSRRRPELAKQLAVIFTVITAALSIWMLGAFETANAGFQFETHTTLLSSLGISWHLGIDGISLFMIVLTGLLFLIAILGIEPEHDAKAYYAWLLLLEAGCMGVFMALDLFVFFIFFEIVLVPMYFLIGRWGHGRREYAATKFFLYTMFGSAFMLVGIVSVAVLTARSTGNPLTFDLVKLAETTNLATVTSRWIFLSFAIAFAIKVPLFPVHTWLPDAHTEAPTAGSVILAGVMLKMGTYGFIRFGLYLFPEATVYFAPLFIALGTIGIVYGAIVATMQRDLKRLVAYSSVAHMGFIVIGIFALNKEGLEGAILQMVNHGISTPALFILVGLIYERRHTREIAKLRGLQKVAPIFAGVFTLVMMSSIGLPGLNGFVGEFLTLLGTFLAHRWYSVIAATGVIIAALYLLWAYQRVFHGEPDEANQSFPELRLREGLALAPLLVLIVFLGIYPKPVLNRLEPSVTALIEHVEQKVDGFKAPTFTEARLGDNAGPKKGGSAESVPHSTETETSTGGEHK
jgi:NADH-quinone oxidoreductase subunit M